MKNILITCWQCIFETIFAGSLVRFMDHWSSLLSPKTREMIDIDMQKFKGRVAWMKKVRGK